jgi:hypothetical protein
MAGAVSFYKFYGFKTITKIERHEIKSNVIDKDTSSMTTDQLRAELECYYKSNPSLDIAQINNTDYTLSAGLCERNWTRRITIAELYKKNILTGCIAVKSGLVMGAGANYTRMITPFAGLGGGFIMYKDTSFMLDISAAFAW